MLGTDDLKVALEAATLLFSVWSAYTSQKLRADLAVLKDQLKEWTYAHFMPRNEMTVYEHRLDRLEERPSNSRKQAAEVVN